MQRDPKRAGLIRVGEQLVGGPFRHRLTVESWACACCFAAGLEGGRGAVELEKILFVSEQRGPGYSDVLEYFLVKRAMQEREPLRDHLMRRPTPLVH